MEWRYLVGVSIIIFCFNSWCNLIDTSKTQPSVFTKNSSIVRVTHSFHDLFLSAFFKSGCVVVLCVSKVSLVLSGSSEELLFSLSFVMFGGLFSEEVVTMENPVSVEGSCTHPDGSDSSEPPLIGFHNEVGIVKHLAWNYQEKFIKFNLFSYQLF